MYSQRATQLVRAPRDRVYAALLDPVAIQTWRVPDDMTASIHEWEPREGGRFRVSLTYRAEDRTGKTEGATDTYSGHFETLVPDELVVERLAFDTDDPELQGSMTMTWTLRDADGATQLDVLHEGLPDVVPPQDNRTGTRMSLTKLAAYVEAAG
ncbi:MAG TPA: SRPBCC domain-containing protein [Nocardioides sp.]|uniref:SRPBCC domain-containing protein n=1 Tax=Nocardioides sp. TaxID=35761 RepID=UPI002E3401A5|nr:SRPBCC domain-containing protein [Nocardioides sp.]HEX5089150.1 SRPBCC domain-containing protein [Nocardioides sp.]